MCWWRCVGHVSNKHTLMSVWVRAVWSLSTILVKPVDPVRQWPWDILLHVATFSNRTRFACGSSTARQCGHFISFIYLSHRQLRLLFSYMYKYALFDFEHTLAIVAKWCKSTCIRVVTRCWKTPYFVDGRALFVSLLYLHTNDVAVKYHTLEAERKKRTKWSESTKC